MGRVHLTDEIYEFIKGEVVFIFELCRIRGIPINGFEIANKLGIRLIPYSSLNGKQRDVAFETSKDGFYIEDLNGEGLIYYNDKNSPERVNMTILHEIGHCVLDHTNGTDAEEAEAKFFAKYAIAPPPLVHCIKPQSPKDIEKAFCISKEAAHNAFVYYLKWLKYGRRYYNDNDVRLLRLFETA